MGKLTTHVLDTAQGCPAGNLTIELWAIDSQSQQRTRLKTLVTNADGRTEQPLLSDRDFKVGTYELVFIVGDYFATRQQDLPNPPFLNRIPLQFSVANPDVHYHVPLLVSPWSYSTYRGS